MNCNELSNFIKEIALEAGELCLKEFETMHDSDIEFKNDKDLVTAVDKKVEAFIIGRIEENFPDHDIFGEETGRTEHNSEYCWVIDPIDGTTSFVHGQPFYSNSIALKKNGVTIVGVVNAPRLNELFYAELGQGAFLNGKPIAVSKRDRLISSVMATGFACVRAGRENNNLPYFNAFLPKLRGIRRFGSAAMDLCYVACGRLEGFWEMDLQPYDYGAGELIVREAGGVVSDFDGADDYSDNGIIATNGVVTEEFITLFNEVKNQK